MLETISRKGIKIILSSEYLLFITLTTDKKNKNNKFLLFHLISGLTSFFLIKMILKTLTFILILSAVKIHLFSQCFILV